LVFTKFNELTVTGEGYKIEFSKQCKFLIKVKRKALQAVSEISGSQISVDERSDVLASYTV
jgi:hypothetical protein